MERHRTRAAPGAAGGPSPGAGEPTAHELRAFVRLADELHFGRAATSLGIAQSSLSEAIRRLEATLDAVLFARTSRRVSLTPAGRRLVPLARQVLDGLSAAREVRAAPSPHGAAGLRIGIEAQGFAELDGPIVRRLRGLRPGTPVALRTMVADPEAFFADRLDVALVRTPMRDERLIVHEVAEEPRGVLVSESHPAAGLDASIDDFLDEPFVAPGPAVAATRDYWLVAERRGGEAPRLGGEALVASEVAAAVAYTGLVCVGCPSVVRAYPLPGLAFSPTADLDPCRLGVAVRAGDDRPLVAEIVAAVRAVVREHATAAPGITPLATAGAGTPPPSRARTG